MDVRPSYLTGAALVGAFLALTGAAAVSAQTTGSAEASPCRAGGDADEILVCGALAVGRHVMVGAIKR